MADNTRRRRGPPFWKCVSMKPHLSLNELTAEIIPSRIAGTTNPFVNCSVGTVVSCVRVWKTWGRCRHRRHRHRALVIGEGKSRRLWSSTDKMMTEPRYAGFWRKRGWGEELQYEAGSWSNVIYAWLCLPLKALTIEIQWRLNLTQVWSQLCVWAQQERLERLY